eukprot:scaffold151720_cov39-Tisochrysis_lutea.AAC.1
MPAWAVLAKSVVFAYSSALLSVVYLSIVLISTDSSERSMAVIFFSYCLHDAKLDMAIDRGPRLRAPTPLPPLSWHLTPMLLSGVLVAWLSPPRAKGRRGHALVRLTRVGNAKDTMLWNDISSMDIPMRCRIFGSPSLGATRIGAQR